MFLSVLSDSCVAKAQLTEIFRRTHRVLHNTTPSSEFNFVPKSPLNILETVYKRSVSYKIGVSVRFWQFGTDRTPPKNMPLKPR